MTKRTLTPVEAKRIRKKAKLSDGELEKLFNLPRGYVASVEINTMECDGAAVVLYELLDKDPLALIYKLDPTREAD